MASSSIVTLWDGTQVPKSVFKTTQQKIDRLLNYGDYGLEISALFKKCSDPSLKFQNWGCGDSSKALKALHFIDESGEVYPIVKAIVLNSMRLYGDSIVCINPIKQP